MTNNVKTNSELLKHEPDLALVEKVSLRDDEPNHPAGYEILRDEYDAIRLTTAAALTPNLAGNLPKKAPSILLQTVEDPAFPGAVDYFDRLAERLARDLGASLISVNLEDLEDLSREFNLQDERREEELRERLSKARNNVRGSDGRVEKTKANGEAEHTETRITSHESLCPREHLHRQCLYSFALFYFGVRSRQKGTEEGLQRNKAAIYALLKSVQIKNRQQNPPGEGSAHNNAPTNIETVLLHFSNTKELSEDSPSWRFLRRFTHRIQELRRSGQKMLILASRDTSDRFYKLRKELFVDEFRTFNVSPSNISAHSAFYEGNEAKFAKAINVRRLKRMLRDTVPHIFNSSLLAKDASAETEEWWQNVVFPGNKVWTESDLKQAVMQIVGQKWGKTMLDLHDIVAVTTRMHRKKVSSGEDKDHENVGQSRSEDDPWKGLTLEKRLDKIRGDCNSYERRLFHCVVDPGMATSLSIIRQNLADSFKEKLKTTYDDVIIDQETKDSVKQLIALSQLRPEAASYTLLQQIRVSGAMFYGPPGTGKTLLCQAVANDSRSNMIALDSASIQSQWIGQTEKNISAAFALATKLSPCVLFIDEVDGLFYRRSNSNKSWERTALNQFLQEMDGLSKRDGAPLVIVATNRPSELDDAFLRRLPHKVFFTLPAVEERARIFRVFLKDEDICPDIDVDDLAGRTDGFSGSDIRSLCGHAALAWAVEQLGIQKLDEATPHLRLHQRHFEKALVKTRPTVSEQSLKDLKDFAKRFNPECYEVHISRN